MINNHTGFRSRISKVYFQVNISAAGTEIYGRVIAVLTRFPSYSYLGTYLITIQTLAGISEKHIYPTAVLTQPTVCTLNRGLCVLEHTITPVGSSDIILPVCSQPALSSYLDVRSTYGEEKKRQGAS
ncbi:hypothetical protein ABW19_dt0204927 [Dactylella cylindrospora]|nr:hypothetical protein ABW19_dt0204927 [Dactylella cylindrospora]